MLLSVLHETGAKCQVAFFFISAPYIPQQFPFEPIAIKSYVTKVLWFIVLYIQERVHQPQSASNAIRHVNSAYRDWAQIWYFIKITRLNYFFEHCHH
jgi:hypothetical protein